MAERLTYWNDKEKKSALPKCINDFGDVVDLEDLCYKIACLEDILERYNIESVENLDSILEKYFSDTWITVTPKITKNWELICDIMASDELNRNFELGVTRDRDTWKRACELACREAPLHCPNPPEYYNAQDEYGSDEPYYIQEGACEFSDDAERCLECQINYFYQQAKKEGENNDTNN